MDIYDKILKHTILNKQKIKNEKQCLEIITSVEFKKLIYNILNLIFKKNKNIDIETIKKNLHAFVFIFYIFHFENSIKKNHGQYETFFINNAKDLFSDFYKILKSKKENCELIISQFELQYFDYIDYYKYWKYENKYYNFFSNFKKYKTINDNISFFILMSKNVINSYVLDNLYKIKNSLLKEFKKNNPDFLYYYKEFKFKNINFNKNYKFIFMSSKMFFDKFLNELKINKFNNIKLLNKDFVERLNKIDKDFHELLINFKLNSVCDYLKKDDIHNLEVWVNNFFKLNKDIFDDRFFTNYNIWKIKNKKYLSVKDKSKYICNFYKFFNDELNILEEEKNIINDFIPFRSEFINQIVNETLGNI